MTGDTLKRQVRENVLEEVGTAWSGGRPQPTSGEGLSGAKDVR